MSNKTWTEDELAQAVNEIQQDRDEWEQAVDRGIGDTALSKLERAAVGSFVSLYGYDENEVRDEHPAEWMARHLVTEPLIAKMAVALFLEWTLNDRAIPDGVTGRHLDQAIDQLMPYAKNSPNLGLAGLELFDA